MAAATVLTVAVVERPTPRLLRRLLQAGVRGIVAATSCPSGLSHAVEVVAAGGQHLDPALDGAMMKAMTPGPSIPGLTGRQCEVLWLCEQGLSTKDIARELTITEDTVRSHVKAILRRFGVSHRVEAVRRAKEEGWM